MGITAKHGKGFTLMELMIVMAIIAIASAVVIPRIGNNEGKIYRAQLKTLTAALNYNRRNAIIMNRPFEMKVEPDTAAGKTAKGDWKSQGADIQWQTDTEKYQNKRFAITFFPQGGATGGTITLQQGSFVAQVVIDSLTGKVIVEETRNE